MLNRGKIRLMTKMAVFEKRDGARERRMDAYFKADYVASQALRSFLYATVSFAVLLAVYACYHFETLMLSLYSMDLVAFAGRLALLYLLFAGGVTVITIVVYTVRYNRMRKDMRRYYRMLSTLLAHYRRKQQAGGEGEAPK